MIFLIPASLQLRALLLSLLQKNRPLRADAMGLSISCRRVTRRPLSRSFDPDLPMKVGQEVFSPILCAPWAKKAISAVADLLEWERVVPTVDSGAPETVVPPDVARNLPLLHASQAGTE